MTRRAGPIGLAIRAASTTPVLTVFAIAVVAMTAFAGAAAPGLLEQVQSDSLRYALNASQGSTRDFSATTRGALVPGSAGESTELDIPADLRPVWGKGLQRLDVARQQFDPLLRDVLGPARAIVQFDAGEAVPPAGVSFPRSSILLRYDPQVSSRVTWVEGDAPVPSADGVSEFGLTAAAADVMAWSIGEERDLPRADGLQRVRLVGIYEPVDASDADWQHSPLALKPSRVQPGLGPPLFTAMGFAAPDDLQTPLGYSDFVSTEVWYPIEVAEVRMADAPDLIAAMRLFSASTVDAEVASAGIFFDGFQFGSTAPLTLGQALARVEAMSALVALIASGPLAVGVVVLALTARMLALRRKTTLQLAQARGASARLRAGVLAAEGLAIGLVGGVGGGVAGAAVGGAHGPVVWLVPALVALTPAVTLSVLGLLVARRRPRADLGSSSSGAARWRLVVELAVVVLAAAAVVLVLTGARSSAGSAPDPLLTVLPLLLAAVGCVVTLRLVPLGLMLVERGVAARRGLIALVGPARSRRDPTVRVAPVLAVVVGVAIAVFSVAFSATVDAGVGVAARSTTGADLRVTGTYISEQGLEALANLDGVARSAPVYSDEQSSADLPNADLTVTVYVIDVAELRSVQTDPESAMPLPDELLRADGEVPVIVSDLLAERVGDEQMEVDGDPVDIVGSSSTQSPLGSATNWIAVDRSRADELVSTTFSPAVVLLALEPGADAGDVAEQARLIVGAGATAVTPQSTAQVRLEDPALIGLRVSLLVAIGAVAALLALAIGMTLVLGAPARGRLLALLVAVGFRRSRELALIVWEVAPALVVALPIGALVGIALPWVIVPALDLTGFVGGALQPAVRLGGAAPLLVVLGFVGVTVLAVLVAALVARRVTTAGTLRSIDEEG